MASMLDKVMGLLGVRDDDELEDELDDQVEEQLPPEPVRLPRTRKEHNTNKKANLVSLTGGQKSQTKMMIIEPVEFEECKRFVEELKQRRSLIIRLDKMQREEAQRIVDFMSGATHALDGNMRKLGEDIFCFAPSSVVIEGELEPGAFDLRTKK